MRLLCQLNKDKHNIAYKEFSIKEDFDAIADYCSSFEILAFSCYIWNITQTIAVIKKIKISAGKIQGLDKNSGPH